MFGAKAATPAGTARAEDPGLSEVREAAEAVPTESVRSKRKSPAYLNFVLKGPGVFAQFFLIRQYVDIQYCLI